MLILDRNTFFPFKTIQTSDDPETVPTYQLIFHRNLQKVRRSRFFTEVCHLRRHFSPLQWAAEKNLTERKLTLGSKQKLFFFFFFL